MGSGRSDSQVSRPTIAVGYCHPDKVSGYFHNSLLGLVRAEASRVGPVIGVLSGPKVDDARNKIVWAMLDTEATHLLMVDADMVLPRDTIHRLLLADKDIVTGLAFIGSFGGSPVSPNIRVRKTHKDGTWEMRPLWDYPVDELVRVEGAGAACMLIKREVLEKILIARGENHPMPWFAHGMANGVQIGEDIAFCLTAQKVGFEVWCDTGLVVPHVKPRFVEDSTYILSLSQADHPYYDEREKVPIYQEYLGNGDTSLDGDR